MLQVLERRLPPSLRPSTLLRLLSRVFPTSVRAVLAWSAQGYLPARIYHNSVSQALAPELFLRGMRLYRGPYKLYVPLHLLPEYLKFEPVTTQRFLGALSKDMTVIDVGANAGYYTLLAGRAVGSKGTVHALEPCDMNRALLERNVDLSRLRNVRIHACAAGAKRARRSFHVTESSFDHGFYSHPIAKTVRQIMVNEIPLDELVTTPVHVVKIDVEGAELDVLNGMTRILRENEHVSLFVEWSPWCMKQAGNEPCDLPDRLKELGFGNTRVLDDLGNRELSVSDVLAMLREAPTKIWYGMIYARRQSVG